MFIRIIRFAYIMVLALYVGGIAMFTFVTTPDISGSFDSDTASGIVDILFDGYFKYSVSVLAAALALVLLIRLADKNTRLKGSVLLILATMILHCFLAFFMYPEMKEMESRAASYGESHDGPEASASISDIHGLSTVLNINLLLNGSILIYLGSLAGAPAGRRQSGENTDKLSRKQYNKVHRR